MNAARGDLFLVDELLSGPRSEPSIPPRLDELRLDLSEGRVAEPGKRLTAPEPGSLVEERVGGLGRVGLTGLLEQPLGPLQIELVPLDAHRVAVASGLDALASQQLAQRMDGDLERVGGCRWRRVAPEPLHEPVTGHALVRVQEEEREQRTLPRPGHRHPGPVGAHLERAEQAELEPVDPRRGHGRSLP